MRFFKTFSSALLLLLIGLSVNLDLQAQQKLTLQQEHLLFKVSGTSTLHNWDMISSEGEGFLTFEEAANGKTNFTSAQVSFKAETLESGKNGMDKNAYKALKTNEYQNISFEFDEFESTGDGKGYVYGYLTVAGFTKSVSLDVTFTSENNQITVQANGAFLLTDFQIDPPTALLGTVKTGDEVTIEVKAQFKH